jgi:hypothetical protein
VGVLGVLLSVDGLIVTPLYFSFSGLPVFKKNDSKAIPNKETTVEPKPILFWPLANALNATNPPPKTMTLPINCFSSE